MNYYKVGMEGEGVPAMYAVLFVCSGNTCRSPMAEALAWKWLEEHAREHCGRFWVGSAGLAAMDGGRASSGAVKAAARSGCKLEGHRSRAFTTELPEMRQNATVVTMTRAQTEYVKRIAPKARVMTLSAWSGMADSGDVSDPFAGSDIAYNKCCEQIKDMVSAGFKRILSGKGIT